MIKVLFVCMGNICRSPTAQAVFEDLLKQRGLAEQFEIDSAGTHTYHEGLPPDKRSTQALLKRNIDMSHLRARVVDEADFEHFDYIVAMDEENLSDLRDFAPPRHHPKLSLLLAFDKTIEDIEVPDPYYGGLNGFERVIDLVEKGSAALLDVIIKEKRVASL